MILFMLEPGGGERLPFVCNFPGAHRPRQPFGHGSESLDDESSALLRFGIQEASEDRVVACVQGPASGEVVAWRGEQDVWQSVKASFVETVR